MKNDQALLRQAERIMQTIQDPEHDYHHLKDVINYVQELIPKLNTKCNSRVCIIGAYWHDVGRSVGDAQGHEKRSAEMLKDAMEKMKYDAELIEQCYLAILYHKWNMTPKTTEGLIVRDADKLAWIGQNRWRNCLRKGKNLDSIIKLLPHLRNEILHFDEARQIYDRDIINLIKILYSQ